MAKKTLDFVLHLAHYFLGAFDDNRWSNRTSDVITPPIRLQLFSILHHQDPDHHHLLDPHYWLHHLRLFDCSFKCLAHD